MREENARLEATVLNTQSQNSALDALISEQEAYLADVQELIARLEERRREWRRCYAELTGQPPEDPAAVKPRA